MIPNGGKNGLAPGGGEALGIDNLSKRFGGAVALDAVSLHVARGEVHGLLGSNGSGKSTLIKVLAGFHAPEPGAEIRLYGRNAPLPMTGTQVRDLGLAFVHQHLGLIPSLSVTENLYIGQLATEENWALDWSDLHDAASDAFARFDLPLDPHAPVATLSAVQRALLAIVRAHEDLRRAAKDHAQRPGVLILDEPTPFLPRTGVEQLFQLVRNCTKTGASVIFVSHDVDEVREITNRATILRDGRLIDTVETSETGHDAFVERIIGKSMDVYHGAAKTLDRPKAQISVEGLSGPGVESTDLDLAKGEILGVTGLIGSGFDNLPAALYGACGDFSGVLHLEGRRIDLADLTPEAALDEGMAYLPGDRLGAAGIGSLSVGDNIAMPVFDRLRGRFGLTSAAISAHAVRLGARAGVKPNVPALPLHALSGGNAQKALMAKWLQTAPRFLLLDEPTQGVDVGARQRIWEALDETAEANTSILIASTDYEQLAQLCHRVLIFAHGSIAAELSGAGLTKDSIAEHCYRSTSRIA